MRRLSFSRIVVAPLLAVMTCLPASAAKVPTAVGMADMVGISYSSPRLAQGKPVSWKAVVLRLDRIPQGFVGNEFQPIWINDLYTWGGVSGTGTTYGILGLNDRGVVKPFYLRQICKAAFDCPPTDPYVLRCAGTYDRSRQVLLQMALSCKRTTPEGTPTGFGGTIDVTLVQGKSALGTFVMYGP